MKPAQVVPGAGAETLIVEDGLGRRVVVHDPAVGEPVEHFILCEALRVEVKAVRERAGRLTNFRHVRYARVRGVETDAASGRVVVVSDHVEGQRLARLLVQAQATRTAVGLDTAVYVMRELLQAVTLLHDSRNVTHGALVPASIVVTPRYRLVVSSHVLGGALDRLRLSRGRLWLDFRVPMPPAAGVPRFDQRADVGQVGMIALALLLGFPLGPSEFPLQPRLIDRAFDSIGGDARAVGEFRAWLERMLPVDSRRPFTSAKEAQSALEDVVIRNRSFAPSPAGLRTLFDQLVKQGAMQPGPVEAPADSLPQAEVPPPPEATSVLQVVSERPTEPPAAASVSNATPSDHGQAVPRRTPPVSRDELSTLAALVAGEEPSNPPAGTASAESLSSQAAETTVVADSKPRAPRKPRRPRSHAAEVAAPAPVADASDRTHDAPADRRASNVPEPSPVVAAEAPVTPERPVPEAVSPDADRATVPVPAVTEVRQAAPPADWPLDDDDAEEIRRLEMELVRLAGADSDLSLGTTLQIEPVVSDDLEQSSSAERDLSEQAIDLEQLVASMEPPAVTGALDGEGERAAGPQDVWVIETNTSGAFEIPAGGPRLEQQAAVVAPDPEPPVAAVSPAAPLTEAPPAAPTFEPPSEPPPIVVVPGLSTLLAEVIELEEAESGDHWCLTSPSPGAPVSRPEENVEAVGLRCTSTLLLPLALDLDQAVEAEPQVGEQTAESLAAEPAGEEVGRAARGLDEPRHESGDPGSPVSGAGDEGPSTGPPGLVGNVEKRSWWARLWKRPDPPLDAAPAQVFDIAETPAPDAPSRQAALERSLDELLAEPPADVTLTEISLRLDLGPRVDEPSPPSETEAVSTSAQIPEPSSLGESRSMPAEDVHDQSVTSMLPPPAAPDVTRGSEPGPRVEEEPAGPVSPSDPPGDRASRRESLPPVVLPPLRPTPAWKQRVVALERLLAETLQSHDLLLSRQHDIPLQPHHFSRGATPTHEVDARPAPLVEADHSEPAAIPPPPVPPIVGPVPVKPGEAQARETLPSVVTPERSAGTGTGTGSTKAWETLGSVAEEVTVDLDGWSGGEAASSAPARLQQEPVGPAPHELAPEPPAEPQRFESTVDLPPFVQAVPFEALTEDLKPSEEPAAMRASDPPRTEEPPAVSSLCDESMTSGRSGRKARRRRHREAAEAIAAREGPSEASGQASRPPGDSEETGPGEVVPLSTKAAERPPEPAVAPVVEGDVQIVGRTAVANEHREAPSDQPAPPWLRGRSAVTTSGVESPGDRPEAPDPSAAPETSVDPEDRGLVGAPTEAIAARPVVAAFETDARSVPFPRGSSYEQPAQAATEAEDASPRVDAVRRRSRFTVDWARLATAAAIGAMLSTASIGAGYWTLRPPSTGRLFVYTNGKGVEVIIDGKAVGTAPAAQDLLPGSHTVELRGRSATNKTTVEVSAGSQTSHVVRWPTEAALGHARITSVPDGAKVTVDGVAQGTAPVTVYNLPAGQHTVVVEAAAGQVKSTVTVHADETAEISIPIFSGWVAVFAPIALDILEGGRLLSTDDSERLLLAAGPHALELVNAGLGYRRVIDTYVEPGKVTPLSIELPKAPVVVSAEDGAELWIDGVLAGTTPLPELLVPLGTREVILRRAGKADYRQLITVTLNAPARIAAP